MNVYGNIRVGDCIYSGWPRPPVGMICSGWSGLGGLYCGLVADAVQEAVVNKSAADAAVAALDPERKVLEMLEKHTQASQCPLAGNSVSQDRKFIDKYMPSLGGWLHYRTVDVSTIKELAKRWYPQVYEAAPKKGGSHRALGDIEESIKELQYYRENLFK